MKINGNLLLLIQGITISTTGMTLFGTVSILWLAKVADSGSLIGLFMLVGSVPTVVMALLGGAFADRFSRKGMIVLADSIIGMMILSLSVVSFLSDSVSIHIISLFAVQFIINTILSLSLPAFFALLPDLVSANRLSMANVLMTSSFSVSEILGRSVGGLLYAVLGVPVLLLITGIGYLLSALSERFIQVPISHTDTITSSGTQVDTQVKGEFMSVIAEIKTGLAYVYKNKSIRHVMIMRLGCLWCLGTFFVALPFLVESRYDKGTAWFGYLLVVFTLGTIVGSVYGGMKFNQLDGLSGRTMLYRLSMLTLPLWCMSLAFIDNIYSAMLPIFFISFSLQGICGTFIATQIQLTTPTDLRGRVMSIYMMMGSFTAVSGFLSGMLIDVLDKNVGLVLGVSGIVGCLILYPLLFNKVWMEFMGYSTRDVLESREVT